MNLVEQREKMVDQLTKVKEQVDQLETQLEAAQNNVQRHIGAIQMIDMLMQEEKSQPAGDENVEA